MKTIIANWKMNVGIRESVALARGTLLALRGRKFAPEIALCPSFTALVDVKKTITRSHVALGAQNVSSEEAGAFTGEVSARMLVETGATHVIIGHSERRRLFGETDEIVGKKVALALSHKLVPIVCIGETKEEHAAGQTEAVVSRQLKAAFALMTPRRDKDRLLVAYEPVWSISTSGTGLADDPQEAAAVHAFIRRSLEQHIGRAQLSVLYGGSVNALDAYGFLREPEIDGVLVGGASVKLQEFIKIIDAASEAIEGQAAAH